MTRSRLLDGTIDSLVIVTGEPDDAPDSMMSDMVVGIAGVVPAALINTNSACGAVCVLEVFKIISTTAAEEALVDSDEQNEGPLGSVGLQVIVAGMIPVLKLGTE